MNAPKDMEKELITSLSKLILERDDDTPWRLTEQEQALDELKCSNTAIGRWINDWDFPFLIETLLLNDAVFAEEFPGVNSTAEERKQLANTLEAHCEDCARCYRKRAYDLEWQVRLKRVFTENKERVGTAIARAVGKG
ncbi:MAG TPA: hypothetical protein VF666_03360 [Pyrinomonadaceae bacterium]